MDSQLLETIRKIYPQVSFVRGESGDDIAVVPNGFALESMERFQAQPNRVRQSPSLQSLESFLAYTDAHKEPQSVIFFDEKNLKAKLFVDYHRANSDPQWKDHTAIYDAELDERWAEWTARDGSAMSQVELASFIERHVRDFRSPTGAEMLSIASNFQVHRQVSYGNAVNLSSGEIQFEYSNTKNSEKGTMTIPDTFSLGIPVFKNGDHYEVEAKLRYRLRDEELSLQYELTNVDDILRDAVAGVMEKLGESQLPVYLGSLR